MLRLQEKDFKKIEAHELHVWVRNRPDAPPRDGGILDIPDHYMVEGFCYVEKPVDTKRQILNIFIPAAYMENGECGGYTAKTAPILFYVAGGAFRYHGLSAMDGRGDVGFTICGALKKGFVVVCANYRSIMDHYLDVDGDGEPEWTGVAPAEQTDLKAALRFLRYNADILPGDMEKIIVQGISSGGAMTQVVASSGNTRKLDSYLEEIGAAKAPDYVKAAVPFCGPGDLEHADMAMDWYFGRFLYEPVFESVENLGKHITEELPRVKHDASGRPVMRVDYAAGKTAYDYYDEYAKAYVDEFICGKLGMTEKEYVIQMVKELIPGYAVYRRENPQDCAGDYFWWDSYETYLAEGNAPDPYYDAEQYPKEGYLNFDMYRVWCADEGSDVAKPTPAFDRIRACEMESNENALFGTMKTGSANFTRLGAAHGENGDGTLSERVKELVDLQNPLCYIEDPETKPAEHWVIFHGVLDGDIPLPLSFNLMKALQARGIDAKLILQWKRRHIDCCRGEKDITNLLNVLKELADC